MYNVIRALYILQHKAYYRPLDSNVKNYQLDNLSLTGLRQHAASLDMEAWFSLTGAVDLLWTP